MYICTCLSVLVAVSAFAFCQQLTVLSSTLFSTVSCTSVCPVSTVQCVVMCSLFLIHWFVSYQPSLCVCVCVRVRVCVCWACVLCDGNESGRVSVELPQGTASGHTQANVNAQHGAFFFQPGWKD